MRRNLLRLVRTFGTLQGPGAPPPIRVAWTPDAGRGVFATRKINMGEIIHSADPVVAHPSLKNTEKLCYFCLRRLQGQGNRNLTSEDVASMQESLAEGEFSVFSSDQDFRSQWQFCSEKCQNLAEAFLAVERKANWTFFHQHCREQGLKFPLLAKRLSCMIISGMASKNILDVLSYVRLPNGIPSSWTYEKDLLVVAFKGAGIPQEKLNFLSEGWYYGVLARISLNVFRVEVVMKEYTDFLAAAAEAVTGEGVVGSAVYILPSMYNHDCDPNINIYWPDNATARLKARREIEAGEELRISYLDASMASTSRRNLLLEVYGFWCQCARCREGD